MSPRICPVPTPPQWRRSRRALSIGAATLLVVAGCRWTDWGKHERCTDISRGAIPATPGTYVCQWQAAQMDRGEQSKYVVHLYEWRAGGNQLGPDGQRHLEQMARRLPTTTYQVVISPANDAALDAERRAVVVQQLANAGVGDAAQRVVVATPEGEGLYGPEAARYGASRSIGISGVGQQGGQGGTNNAFGGTTNSFGGGAGGFGGGGGGVF